MHFFTQEGTLQSVGEEFQKKYAGVENFGLDPDCNKNSVFSEAG